MSIGPRPPDVTVALDNDVLNDWRFRKPATVKAIADYIAVVKAPPAIPSHTIFETMHGLEKVAVKSGTVNERGMQAREQVRKLISECTILPFNQEAAEIAAYIFPRLSQKERNKHWADVFIAATALAHDHGIATRNRTDYELIAKHAPPRYPSLRIEIWKTD
jgi:predicted nucleic acid-binding protein